MQQSSTVFTYDDYLSLPGDGKRYEIIDGDLSMTPAPSPEHQRVLGRLFRQLDEVVRRNQLGEVFISPIDIVLSMTNVVQPDLVFISEEQKHIVTKRNVVAPPDLVVEILSESTEKADRTMKKTLYERYGVKEYWIVDAESQQVEIHILKEGKYVSPTTFSINDTVKSSLLPGLSFRTSSLFQQ